MICDQCETVAHCMKNGCVPKTTKKDEALKPDWKAEYLKTVELHCITLDELREAEAWIKNLEKLMADQDVMLERQTARIVDLQTHIANLEGED